MSQPLYNSQPEHGESPMRSILICLSFATIMGAGCSGTTEYVAPGPPVVLTLVPGNRDRSYKVHVQPAAGPEQRCAVPCELRVASGTAQVAVSGDATFEKNIVVPKQSVTARIHEVKDGPYIAGALLTSLGTLLAGGGAIASPFVPAPGLITVAAGLALDIPGLILLLAAGSNKIIVKPNDGESFSPQRRRV